MTTNEAKTISVTIERAPGEVYAFLCAPENFPRWASGLCQSIAPAGSAWLAETPNGPMTVRFTPRNDFGVVDHRVDPSPDVEIYVPMRVLANGDGSEVIFTLFRLTGMSDTQFAEDLRWVERDLKALKALLEE
ncbi:SRPBCC family protein [Crenobacter cavernae]|uniref:SRPBCC family protein n=1 Tax=Crenobacter cavernae TaxID=2290923 RepID=A0A345Y5Q4_9NEIS|nr:SRPBCC family protein [Crenobacter cavernae]AXK39256.1 SRPBCC family protein [Crenobacter cavernae]RXZ43714.1 SRPBCC family protein [Crenobacter cavernae]